MIIETLPGKNFFGHFPMILPDSGPADFDSQNVRGICKFSVHFGKLENFGKFGKWKTLEIWGQFWEHLRFCGEISGHFGDYFGKFGNWKIWGNFGEILEIGKILGNLGEVSGKFGN